MDLGGRENAQAQRRTVETSSPHESQFTNGETGPVRAALRLRFQRSTGVPASDSEGVRAWQAQHGLPPTGRVDRATAARAAARGGAAEVVGERSEASQSIGADDEGTGTGDSAAAVQALFNPGQSSDQEFG